MAKVSGSRHVFTYGSLMFDEVWHQVVGGSYRSTPAQISGFARRAVKGEEYPALITAGVNEHVSGRLYLSVSPRDLVSLDRFEGPQYVRSNCDVLVTVSEVPGAKGRCDTTNHEPGNIDACCYVWRDAYQQLVQAHDWDEQAFRQRGLTLFLRKYRGFDAH